MKAATQRNDARRPKMEPAHTVQVDNARRRVLASTGPTLLELQEKLGNVPEVSGVIRRPKKSCA